MQPRLSFLRSRASLVALVAASALAGRVTQPTVPPSTLDGLASLLGSAVGGVVKSGDIGWEPSRGFVGDALFGRPLVFLAAESAGAPRDLYRGWVRVGLDGKPTGVVSAKNLTRTPLGDDSGLRVHERTAIVATSAFGRIQAISLFELGGVRPEERTQGVLERVRQGLTSWRRTGTFAGVGRADVVLDVPAEAAALRLEPGRLIVDFGEGGEGVRVDLASRRASALDGGPAQGTRVVTRPAEVAPFLAWAADELRERVGAETVLWLESRVFGARDTLERAAHAVFSGGHGELRAGGSPPVQAAEVDSTWPPPPVTPLFARATPGEGTWTPVAREWLPRAPGLKGEPPPYFYRTFIRPDPDRPYAEVHLIALDMRQLEVHMVAGYEDPEPLVGPPGTGRLPEDAGTYRRVAATFNGAFKTTHGEYGMMVGRRVLVPPVPGAATVVVTHDGELGLGTWPTSKELPGDVMSFRQNLDPLVESGVPNPSKRSFWGWHLAEGDVQTERTALCVTSAGHALYAWGKSVSGPRLADALVRAGCDYAVHLDMNPTHCGFVFTRVEDLARHAATLELAHPGMSLNADRFVRWSQKDFFYVLVRDTEPKPLLGAAWSAAPTQPNPPWLPGLFESKVSLGNLTLRVLTFEKGRFDWVVRAGEREPSVSGAGPKLVALEERELGRARAALNLGRTTERTGYGLAFGKRASIELRRPYASLVSEPGRSPRLLSPGELPALEDGREVVQLPLIAQAGEVLAEARRPGAQRLRAGLCVTPLGRVLYAEVEHDSDDPIASVLVAAGCSVVVSTDRGSHHPAFAHLAGSEEPPRRAYETTVLHALSRPAKPHAFTWKPDRTEER